MQGPVPRVALRLQKRACTAVCSMKGVNRRKTSVETYRNQKRKDQLGERNGKRLKGHLRRREGNWEYDEVLGM